MQRPRSPSKQAQDNAVKRLRIQPSSPLLIYQFLWPMMHKYCSNDDVLESLIPTCKAMKPLLLNYKVKGYVTLFRAMKLNDCHRYLPVKITAMMNVKGEDLHAYTSLETIWFDAEYDQPLLPGKIPLSVKRITFGAYFHQPIGPDVLPQGLTYLDLGEEYNQVIEPHVLPNTLTTLKFSTVFNQPMSPGTLPSSLRIIGFSRFFNQLLPPGVLSDSLTEVYFGHDFNQPLEVGSLPSSTKVVSFGTAFKQNLEEYVLPSSVRKLVISYDFKGSVHLPPELPILFLWCGLHRANIANSWPSSLTEVHLGGGDPLPPGSLSNWITKLSCACPILHGSIPNSVTQLVYLHTSPPQPGVIPASVKTLRIDLY